MQRNQFGRGQQPQQPTSTYDYQTESYDENGSDANIRVVVRVRPLNNTESRRGDGMCVRVGTDGETLQVLN